MSRDQVSPRDYPATLPPIEYDRMDQIGQVQEGGCISCKGRDIKVPKAFAGEPVALWPTTLDCVWDVFFIRYGLAQIDLRQLGAATQPVAYAPEHA
jgi:hypothetical protein